MFRPPLVQYQNVVVCRKDPAASLPACSRKALAGRKSLDRTTQNLRNGLCRHGLHMMSTLRCNGGGRGIQDDALHRKGRLPLLVIFADPLFQKGSHARLQRLHVGYMSWQPQIREPTGSPRSSWVIWKKNLCDPRHGPGGGLSMYFGKFEPWWWFGDKFCRSRQSASRRTSQPGFHIMIACSPAAETNSCLVEVRFGISASSGDGDSPSDIADGSNCIADDGCRSLATAYF